MVYLTIIKYYLYISITEKPINKTSYTRKREPTKMYRERFCCFLTPFSSSVFIYSISKNALFFPALYFDRRGCFQRGPNLLNQPDLLTQIPILVHPKR